MSQPSSKSLFLGLASGIAPTALAAILMGQGASRPVKSEPQYFVTADGDEAHLCVREGNAIRFVGHGACKECTDKGRDPKDREHKEGDGNDHAGPKPKK